MYTVQRRVETLSRQLPACQCGLLPSENKERVSS